MSTDYNLPEWFYDDDVTDEERNRWFVQERCRRQVARQKTPYVEHLEKKIERLERKIEAMPDTVDLADNR